MPVRVKRDKSSQKHRINGGKATLSPILLRLATPKGDVYPRGHSRQQSKRDLRDILAAVRGHAWPSRDLEETTQMMSC